MNVLDRIWEAKREALPKRMADVPLQALREQAEAAGPTRGFLRSIQDSLHEVALIAEVKKASPVKGPTRAGLDPVAVATRYEEVGVDCLSVLTDQPFFQGSNQDLADCRNATTRPVLRKDFTIDAYDIYEARAIGADAVLLIVNGLEKAQLIDLRVLAESLGMDVLVEAHSLQEAELALETGARLIGVNNRDLTTFETSIDVACQVVPQIAAHATVVSESALRSREDIDKVKEAGARAVLIGTAFCAAPEPGARVLEVMGW
ncbi:MAG: indole-3-glycerol phosphate synthase TrpC [Fimbriimonadaceae bacterium]|nr:indole-3-glycerol phosphate synthase TrpC [Fimbriimonadaceae bacterium]QYK57060.1 MAG: indole-3-glycerol phosphate synthase TrpC [Fimbriimonadaceae bacterium]